MRENESFDPSTKIGITPADEIEVTRAFAGRNEQRVGKNLIFSFGVAHGNAGNVGPGLVPGATLHKTAEEVAVAVKPPLNRAPGMILPRGVFMAELRRIEKEGGPTLNARFPSSNDHSKISFPGPNYFDGGGGGEK